MLRYIVITIIVATLLLSACINDEALSNKADIDIDIEIKIFDDELFKYIKEVSNQNDFITIVNKIEKKFEQTSFLGLTIRDYSLEENEYVLITEKMYQHSNELERIDHININNDLILQTLEFIDNDRQRYISIHSFQKNSFHNKDESLWYTLGFDYLNDDIQFRYFNIDVENSNGLLSDGYYYLEHKDSRYKNKGNYLALSKSRGLNAQSFLINPLMDRGILYTSATYENPDKLGIEAYIE